MRRYAAKHVEQIKEYKIKYREKNKDKINKKLRERKSKDPIFKLTCNLRSRLNVVLKKNQKKGSAVRDLGCTIEFFKRVFRIQILR